jgi:hypothetical protein
VTETAPVTLAPTEVLEVIRSMVAWEPAAGVAVLLEEMVAVGVEPVALVLLLAPQEVSRRSEKRQSGASVPIVGWKVASLHQPGRSGIGFLM